MENNNEELKNIQDMPVEEQPQTVEEQTIDVAQEVAENETPAQKPKKDVWSSIKRWVNKKLGRDKDKSHFISAKESRRISKENFKIMREYEARKKRKNVPESEFLDEMRDPNNVVEFEDLNTYFFTSAGVVKAVNGVTFSIPQGATVGVVGESGCGKSVTSLSLMQLVQAPTGQVIEGSKIRFRSTVNKKDENGKLIPIYEYEVDENGEKVLDEEGNPKVKTQIKKDKKGREVKDKQGNPVYENVQATDANGIPLFETEEKVYNVNIEDTNIIPVPEETRKILNKKLIKEDPLTPYKKINSGKIIGLILLLMVIVISITTVIYYTVIK